MNLSVILFPAPGHINSILSLLSFLSSSCVLNRPIKLYIIKDGEHYLRDQLKLFPNLPFELVLYGEQLSLKRDASSTLSKSGLSAVLAGLQFLNDINDATVSFLTNTQERTLYLCDELFYKVKNHPTIFYVQSLSAHSTSNKFGPAWIKFQTTNIYINYFLNKLTGLLIFKNSKKSLKLLPYTKEFDCFDQNQNEKENKLQSFFHTGPWSLDYSSSFNDSPNISSSSFDIYVSLGTLVDEKRKTVILSLLKNVCDKLQLKTIISWGKWVDQGPEINHSLPLVSSGYVQVVPRVNQREILSCVKLFITHGGLNSAQEAIQSETPMLVIPLKHDQYGVAKRVEVLGFGSLVHQEDLSFETLCRSIKNEMSDELFKKRKKNLKEFKKNDIERTAGLKKAVEIIKKVYIS